MVLDSSVDHRQQHGLQWRHRPQRSFKEVQSRNRTLYHLGLCSGSEWEQGHYCSNAGRSHYWEALEGGNGEGDWVCMRVSSRLLHTTPPTLLGNNMLHCRPQPSLTHYHRVSDMPLAIAHLYIFNLMTFAIGYNSIKIIIYSEWIRIMNPLDP